MPPKSTTSSTDGGEEDVPDEEKEEDVPGEEEEEDVPGEEKEVIAGNEEGDGKKPADEGSTGDQKTKDKPPGERTAHEIVSSSKPFLFKFVRLSEGKDSANEGSLPSSKVGAADKTSLGGLRSRIPAMSPKSHTFCLQDGTAIGDDTTVAEYFNIDHQVISSSTPTPSVTIRFKGNNDKTHSAEKVAAQKTERLERLKKLQEDLVKLGPDHTFTDRTAQELKRQVQLLDASELIDPAAYKPGEIKTSKFISAMDEDDWDAVIGNCSVMHGWCIDPKNSRISRAPKAAFKLRSGLNMPAQTNKSPEPAPTDKEGTKNLKEDTTKAIKKDTTKITTAPAKQQETAPTKKAESSLKSFPSYTIEDESAVEISVATHQYEMSMATNDFSSHTFEASVSGGVGPYSAGVSAGFAKEDSSGHTGSKSNFSKTMVASYKFPRVTIQLPSEDLEPTQALKDAIEHFNTTKNINHLFKIRSTFGDFFSHVVVLGGRLQTTKIMSKEANTDESTEKEKFKASVGASFSSTFVSASAKYGHESSKSKDTATATTNTSENLTFDARGGNTILAADPPSWCASVYDFHNWRVIGQSDLIDLERTIGSICKYPFGERWFPSVERWFAQAVPTLNMYLKVPDSCALSFRMKAVGDQVGPYSYLAHLPKAPVTPVHTYSVIHSGSQIFPHKNLFSPACTQAPVLLAYNSDYYGVKSLPPPNETGPEDERFMQTVWKFIVPFDEFLQHGSLVQLQPHNGNKKLYMTVYRNRQGIFLPTISGSGEPAYWRVLRAIDPMSPEETKIKDGDSIRLCWQFSDQKVGFRDFKDDSFGRHYHQIPSDLEKQELYFKTPFPYFNEYSSESTFLAMSHQQGNHTEDINFLNPYSFSKSSRQYLMYDLKFRLDSVKTSRVELEDNYMFEGANNEGKELIREPDTKALSYGLAIFAQALNALA